MHQPSSRSPTAPSNGVATGAAADGAFGGYPQPPALNGLGMSGYSDIYGPTGLASFSGGLNGLGVNTQGQGSNPSSGFGNNPASPYLSLQGSPNPAGLGFQSSPNLNGGAFPSQQQQQQQQQSASGAPGSFNGSGHSPGGQYEALPASPNPYSPNPYAPSFVSNNGMAGAGGLADFGLATSGLGFGPGSFMGGLMSPSMMMGSPGLGSPTLSSFGSPFQGFSMGSPQLGGPAMQSGRTVYVGNLPSDASVDELLSQVRFGPIDNVKIIPEKVSTSEVGCKAQSAPTLTFWSFWFRAVLRIHLFPRPDYGSSVPLGRDDPQDPSSRPGAQDRVGQAVGGSSAGDDGRPAERRHPQCLPR